MMSDPSWLCDASWLGEDGRPVECPDKLRLLAEEEAEVANAMRGAFEDAILMGVGPSSMRARLHALVERLADPRRR